MEFLPLFFDLKGKQVLVVGGGEVAYRKATLLTKAGSRLTVVAPDVREDLIELAKESGGEVISSEYSADQLKDKVLVIAATDNLAVNKQVSEDAKAINLPVNVVDQPSLCTFIFPAIVDRSPIIAAVSSGGSAPVLARLLRAKLETVIPATYGQLAALADKYREKVKARFTHINQRRGFWEKILQGQVAEMIFAGKPNEAEELLQKELEEKEQLPKERGEVYLVGAGPGDPDLLTFKALRLMQQADIVLYDRLVSDQIVDMCRRDAERIYVGKARSDHAVPQGEINQLLVKLAKEGHRVLRLKGGDPFIFGRGGEEIEELAEEGVSFQVVPGITAAAGCSSYSGIPLTHRDYAQSVRFVTGHLKNNTADLPWAELVHPNQTIVFYMGLMGLPSICQKLQEHGMEASTPIALVQKGTTPDHKVVISTLENMPEDVKKTPVAAPTLIIVGNVVQLHDKLKWFNPDQIS